MARIGRPVVVCDPATTHEFDPTLSPRPSSCGTAASARRAAPYAASVRTEVGTAERAEVAAGDHAAALRIGAWSV